MTILTRLYLVFALALLPGLALSQAAPDAPQTQTEAISESQQPAPDSGVLALIAMQLVFACIPLSIAMQIHALCKLEGGLHLLARLSACAMGALWIFVIVTAIAGSNLSPIWLVYLSPLFLVYLLALLFAWSRVQRGEYGVLTASDM